MPLTKAPVVGELTSHFLAEPERPLGLPGASISYSAQPVFNTKRGKGGIRGARKGYAAVGEGGAWTG